MNAVEREPVETRVLNPTAREASYKPKQRSYRKTKLKKLFLLLFFFGGFCRGDFILEPVKRCYVENLCNDIGTLPVKFTPIGYTLVLFFFA